MAASLASARSVDDRRRRRLAKADARGGTPAPRKRSKANDEEKWRGSRLPLRKIISKHRWKILLLGLLMLVPMAGLGVAAFRIEYLAQRAGPAVADLLDPVQNRLGRAWGSFVLLTSSALSALIFWVRSRSPADFGGRYGIWLWAAAGCFLFSAAVATDAHLTWADTVLYFRWVNFPQLGPENTRILCWFAPSALFGLGLVRLLHLDMRRCWSSVLTLWLAVFAWVGAAFLMSQTKWSVDIPHRELASKGAALLGHVSLVVSLLLHARFVLYETAAPPAEKSSTEGRSFSLFGLFARSSSDAKAAEEPASRKKSAKKPARPKKATTRRTKADVTEAESDEIPSSDVDEVESDESESDESDFEAAAAPATIPAHARAGGQANAGRGGGQNAGGHNGGGSANGSHGSAPGGNGKQEQKGHAGSASRPTPPPQKASSHHEEDEDEDGDDMQGDGASRDSLKGLSKRERRKLQKQWREEQRKAA